MIRTLKTTITIALIASSALAFAHHGPRFFAGPTTSSYVATFPILAQVGGASEAATEPTSNPRLPSGAYGPTLIP